MINEIYERTKLDMASIISNLNNNLDKIRTGRINTSLFDSVLVECYGKRIKVNQISSIVIMNNNSVKISPWDKENIQKIHKAITASDLGLNPSIANNEIKITLPPMNEERRLEIMKKVRKVTEGSKISIRSVRREKNNISKKYLKEKLITKDEDKLIQDKIQEITNEFILEVNECLRKKEEEIMKI